MGTVDRHDEDAELVAEALAEKPDAFAKLYEKYRQRVYRVAYHFVHNKADALDLCQDVFVRAYEALDTFKGEARFSTWLLRIASNTCVDFCRQAKVRRAGELDERTMSGDERVPQTTATPNPTRGLEREEIRMALDEAVAQLTPEHRAVFVLHAVEEMSYQEIAEAVGCPVGTVMSRLHYARQRLRGLLAWLKRE
ncbi:MAG: RNA polymerase sigma factor [Candidatus Brocadiia bacterium]